jgi:D-alanyl-D-alanine carboxypeptidase
MAEAHSSRDSLRRMRTPSVLAVCICLTGVLLLAGATPAHAIKTDPGVQVLKRSLKRLVKLDEGPPGAIAIVQRQGDRRRVVKAGFANLAPTERPHPTDHTRIASVAKAFSGAVAFSLVEEGRLSLDTTIGERLPDLPTAWHPVTLRQLLNHTSGVPDYTEDPDFAAFFSADPQAQIPPRQLLDFVADEPLGFAPGSTYRYSNSDNIILALMAEAATATPYETLLATHVYAPLGMSDTSLPSASPLPEPFIHGYDVTPGAPPEDISTAISPSGAWASGGIVSTPADLNRFVRGYVGGELFSKNERVQQFQFRPGESHPPGPGDNTAGLALFKYRTDCGTVFGHTGSFPGYTPLIAATRNGQSSVVMVVNTAVDYEAGGKVFSALLKAERRAVCAALTRTR